MFTYTTATQKLLEYVETARGTLDPKAIRESDEAIHELRVAIRRLRSVLRPFRALYDERGLVASEVVLRRFARETGALRDEEVLRETLADIELREEDRANLVRWQEGRSRRERGLRERVAVWSARNDGLSPRAKLEVLGRVLVHAPRTNPPLTKFLVRANKDATKRLERRVKHTREADVESLHATRIAAKKLRYVVEFTRALKAPGAAEQLPSLELTEKVATKIQKRLGLVHDFDTALEVMPRALTLRQATREAVLHGLVKGREAAVKKALGDLESDVGKL